MRTLSAVRLPWTTPTPARHSKAEAIWQKIKSNKAFGREWSLLAISSVSVCTEACSWTTKTPSPECSTRPRVATKFGCFGSLQLSSANFSAFSPLNCTSIVLLLFNGSRFLSHSIRYSTLCRTLSELVCSDFFKSTSIRNLKRDLFCSHSARKVSAIFLISRFGTRPSMVKRSRVSGLFPLLRMQWVIACRSYVWPSVAETGSSNKEAVIGAQEIVRRRIIVDRQYRGGCCCYRSGR